MALNVIAIEEHFWTPELQGLRPVGLVRDPEHARRLDDIGALRIAEMDASGIDMQVLSETAPAVQQLDPDTAIPLARRSNDYLHEQISKNPTRFAGFAALPVADPKAAADELERAVTKLGFKGAMFMGLCKGRFLDEKFFWPIFERAEQLDVPVYLHPSKPHQAVIDAYFKDHPSLIGPSLGFGNEVLTMAARLVVGGVLDAYPNLKVIIGHLGEGLPFLQWRMDRSLARDAKLPKSFTDYVKQHFWITTSGNFSDAAPAWALLRKMIDSIFDLFGQVDRTLARASGGLGLGLTVVRRVLELHGGKIEARSEGLGKGSEFIVRLPLLPESRSVVHAVKRPRSIPVQATARASRVLVVDDNVDATRAMEMLVRSWGHEVAIATDGSGALEVAASFAPETALIDIGLPGMDGYELAQRLRANPAHRDMHLVAMTGYGREEDRAAAKAAGFDEHLVKPADPEELKLLLAQRPQRGEGGPAKKN